MRQARERPRADRAFNKKSLPWPPRPHCTGIPPFNPLSHFSMEASEEGREPSSLPTGVLRIIAAKAARDEPNPGNRLLLALSMCGVCSSWRSACCQVPEEAGLAFDGLDSGPPAPGGMMSRFRRAPMATKTVVFTAAARLLSGERLGKENRGHTLAPGPPRTPRAVSKALDNGSFRTVRAVAQGPCSSARGGTSASACRRPCRGPRRPTALIDQVFT